MRMLAHHEKKASNPGTPEGSTGLKEGRDGGSDESRNSPLGDVVVSPEGGSSDEFVSLLGEGTISLEGSLDEECLSFYVRRRLRPKGAG